MFALVDDETKVLGERSDLQLLETLQTSCSAHPDFLSARHPGTHEFGIQHFAGPVYYHVEGFVVKNRESFAGSLLMCLNESTNPFVVDLFAAEFALAKKTATRKRAPTVGMKFKTSLKGLIRRLRDCHPYFVRCIKPNEKKLPNMLDDSCVLRQLR